jgi:hypothetical protein
MNCREFAELLIDFLAGELDPEHQHEADGHMRCCPPCLTLLETYRLTIHLSQRLPCQPLPPSCEQRLLALLDRNEGGLRGDERLA